MENQTSINLVQPRDVIFYELSSMYLPKWIKNQRFKKVTDYLVKRKTNKVVSKYKKYALEFQEAAKIQQQEKEKLK